MTPELANGLARPPYGEAHGWACDQKGDVYSCATDRFKTLQEAREAPECVKLFGDRSVRVEMHYIISDFAYSIQFFTEDASVDRQSQLGPTAGILEESDVLAKSEIGNSINLSLRIIWVSGLCKLTGLELRAQDPADVVLDLTEQHKRFCELLELQVEIAGGDDTRNAIVRTSDEDVLVCNDDRYRLKKSLFRNVPAVFH